MKALTTISLLSQALCAAACLTEQELRNIHGGLPTLERRQDRRTNRTNANTIPIGTGDRFKNGTVAPRGIGSQTHVNFTTVYNSVEIKSATLGLVNEFNLTYFELPHKTYENRTMYGFRVPGKRGYQVFLESGIHARERGGPDHMLNFVADLLWAKREGKGLAYGGVTYTAADVATVTEFGIVVVPLVNPDGVAFDHTTHECWRKNRNPAAVQKEEPEMSVGVDLNRNFEAVWDYHKLMANITDSFSVSDEPASQVYHGAAPLSEPEAKNIDWVFDQTPDVRWFVDLHSHATQVLYGWGHDTNQVRDRNMNMLNHTYDGKRGAVPDDPDKGYVYGEYMEQMELDKNMLVSGRVADGMLAASGRSYTAQTSVGLYPTTGAVSDQLSYRSLFDKSKKDALGITVEFGSPNRQALCDFYPTIQGHRLNMFDVGAGMMEFLLAAARFS